MKKREGYAAKEEHVTTENNHTEDLFHNGVDAVIKHELRGAHEEQVDYVTPARLVYTASAPAPAADSTWAIHRVIAWTLSASTSTALAKGLA